MNSTVRPVLARDRAEHARMRAALWPDADPDELAAEVDAFLAQQDEVAFVAENEQGRVYALAEASVRPFANGVDESPCAFLEGVWVDSDARRSGVGRALVTAVEDWARGRGFSELGSDAALDNAPSYQMHTALGFEERERVICFRKRLQPR